MRTSWVATCLLLVLVSCAGLMLARAPSRHRLELVAGEPIRVPETRIRLRFWRGNAMLTTGGCVPIEAFEVEENDIHTDHADLLGVQLGPWVVHSVEWFPEPTLLDRVRKWLGWHTRTASDSVHVELRHD